MAFMIACHVRPGGAAQPHKMPFVSPHFIEPYYTDETESATEGRDREVRWVERGSGGGGVGGGENGVIVLPREKKRPKKDGEMKCSQRENRTEKGGLGGSEKK